MTLFSSLYGSYLDQELGTDDATVLFTTVRRQGAINKGIGEFANLTECMARRVQIPVVAGQSEYDLNSTLVIAAGDFSGFGKDLVEYHVTDTSGNQTILAHDDFPRRDVDWLNQYQPGWRISTQASSIAQTPSFWYVRPDGASYNLGLTKPPGLSSNSTASIWLSYLAQTQTLTSGTQEPFTVGATVRTDLRSYHQAVVHYAAHQLEKLRRDDQESDRQLQKFLGYVSRYLQNQRIKGGRQIRQAKEYFTRRGGDRGIVRGFMGR